MTSDIYFAEVANQWDAMRKVFFSDEVKETAFRKAGISTKDILAVAVDVGAGTGFVTEGLVKRGLQVIAVDPVPEMIEILKTKPFAKVDVDCRLGQAENLPIADKEVVFAFANMSLHHVEDPRQAIAEMFRVLQSKGRVVITDLDEHNVEVLRTEHNDRWMGFKREAVQGWLQEAGFEDIDIASVGSCCGSETNMPSGGAGIGIFVASGRRPA
jgi:ubiquinone/menaquinone biosynthesis C-methylase UbiE